MDITAVLERAELTQRQLAEKLGIGQASISKWRKNGIPLDRVVEVEAATGIPRHDLRPDLFGRLKKRAA